MNTDPKPVPQDEDQITDTDVNGGAGENTADEDANQGDKTDLGDE